MVHDLSMNNKQTKFYQTEAC